MSAYDPQAEKVGQFTVQPDDDGVRLDRWFKRHLPQIGFATVDGTPRERLVLADWEDRGHYLEVDANGARRREITG